MMTRASGVIAVTHHTSDARCKTFLRSRRRNGVNGPAFNYHLVVDRSVSGDKGAVGAAAFPNRLPYGAASELKGAPSSRVGHLHGASCKDSRRSEIAERARSTRPAAAKNV